MMFDAKILGALLIIVQISHGGKILGLFNHPAFSHTFLGKVLMRNLAEKGHEVTMVSAFPMDEPIANYKDIHLSVILENINRAEKISTYEIINMSMSHTIATFKHRQLEELVKNGTTFDVIIMDMFYNDGLLIYGHLFKAPIIIMSSFGNNLVSNIYSGNSLPYSYVPGAGLAIDDNIDFKGRFILTGIGLYIEYKVNLLKQRHYKIIHEHFDNVPPIEDLYDNIALVLANSHYSFETVRPWTPNIIPIGGFHVQKPKPLAKDLEKSISEAEHGVIYFSLGSQIKISTMGNESIMSIIGALSKLPQTILWKNDDTIEDLPKNVKVSKWYPQSDVLAHPNVKAFITHGGALSMIEAVHYGVPMLGIPSSGDQFTNMKFAETRGFGTVVDPSAIDEDTFYNSLHSLIYDPKYMKAAKHQSSLLRNQPLTPLENAVFWTEHVMEHKGGSHLRPFSLKLPWYKYYLVDVIAVSLALILAILLYLRVFWYLLKKILFVTSGHQKQKNKTE